MERTDTSEPPVNARLGLAYARTPLDLSGPVQLNGRGRRKGLRQRSLNIY
ncbi:MAG TPA: hypothetical protein VNF50_10200 [Acidimicrobiales bacterium]|nr:hypothetical protein [Acidimicrobiales bacterium]